MRGVQRRRAVRIVEIADQLDRTAVRDAALAQIEPSDFSVVRDSFGAPLAVPGPRAEALAGRMRAQGGGTIALIGSVAGDRARGGPYAYGTRGDPPALESQWLGYDREMMHFCIDRHNGFVNHLFMDWSSRTVGVKELWKLKWHKDFEVDGPWTASGGVNPGDWPQWMRRFTDY